MKQQSLTWFSWKKLTITCIILFVIGVSIYFYMMFRHIHASKIAGFDETEAYILAETDMITVDKMYAFQEETLYHIAYTKDKQNKAWIQFIPIADMDDAEEAKTNKNDKDETKQEDNQIIAVEVEDTLPQSQIEEMWAGECNQCELKGSTPAILDDEPLWELTYIDDKNRYVIEYRQLSDGETYEQLKLNRKYNARN